MMTLSMTASHADSEYRVLRDTIRTRGSLRVTLFLATLVAWAALLTAAVVAAGPLLALVPLVTLAAGFEAVYALHVGVERIGRYLQVFYEAPGTLPAWERTAMAFGRHASGIRLDALFSPVFAVAVLVNLALSLADARPVVTGIVALAHAGFALRLGQARRTASRQREDERRRLQTLKDGPPAGGPDADQSAQPL